jgi:hypothetical protein
MKGQKTLLWFLLGITVFFAAGCATGGGGRAQGANDLYPAKIQEWIDLNQDTAYYGTGISSIDGDESFAVREATTIARSALAGELETKVGNVAINIAARGGTQKAVEGTKQIAAQVLTGTKTVGPVKGNGNIYVLKYIDRETFDNRAKEVAKAENVKITEAELNEILRGL